MSSCAGAGATRAWFCVCSVRVGQMTLLNFRCWVDPHCAIGALRFGIALHRARRGGRISCRHRCRLRGRRALHRRRSLDLSLHRVGRMLRGPWRSVAGAKVRLGRPRRQSATPSGDRVEKRPKPVLVQRLFEVTVRIRLLVVGGRADGRVGGCIANAAASKRKSSNNKTLGTRSSTTYLPVAVCNESAQMVGNETALTVGGEPAKTFLPASYPACLSHLEGPRSTLPPDRGPPSRGGCLSACDPEGMHSLCREAK